MAGESEEVRAALKFFQEFDGRRRPTSKERGIFAKAFFEAYRDEKKGLHARILRIVIRKEIDMAKVKPIGQECAITLNKVISHLENADTWFEDKALHLGCAFGFLLAVFEEGFASLEITEIMKHDGSIELLLREVMEPLVKIANLLGTLGTIQPGKFIELRVKFIQNLRRTTIVDEESQFSENQGMLISGILKVFKQEE